MNSTSIASDGTRPPRCRSAPVGLGIGSFGKTNSVTTSDRAEITPTYDSIGRLTHLDGPTEEVSLAFDLTGALPTSVTWSDSTPGTVGFGYNGLAQVSSVTVTGAASVSYTYDLDDLPEATEIRYEYDALGRVVARYVDNDYDRGWLWRNQLEPVAEVDDEGDVTKRYVYGSRGHVRDYVITGGVTYRILTDYRGSVRAGATRLGREGVRGSGP